MGVLEWCLLGLFLLLPLSNWWTYRVASESSGRDQGDRGDKAFERAMTLLEKASAHDGTIVALQNEFVRSVQGAKKQDPMAVAKWMLETSMGVAGRTTFRIPNPPTPMEPEFTAPELTDDDAVTHTRSDRI